MRKASLADLVLPGLGASRLDYENAFRRTEKHLSFYLKLFKLLAEKLRDKLGSDALGPELTAFVEAFNTANHKDLIGKLDSLVAKGQEPAVVRELKTVTGFTWDEVYELFSYWPTLALEQKHEWCARYMIRQAIPKKLVE